MPRKIVHSPRARIHIESIYDYLTEVAGADVSRAFTAEIVGRCDSLKDFPERGTPRPELGDGVRTIPYKRRVTIAYVVKLDRVEIVGVFYAGQDVDNAELD